MGTTGITVPFLVAALALARAEKADTNSIRAVLKEIAEDPVEGFVVEVRWCGVIDAPVLSVAEVSKSLPFKSAFLLNGIPTLGFSTDAQSMLNLNCSNFEDCLEKLTLDAARPVESMRFSRNRNPKTGDYEYGDLSAPEIQFVRKLFPSSKET